MKPGDTVTAGQQHPSVKAIAPLSSLSQSDAGKGTIILITRLQKFPVIVRLLLRAPVCFCCTIDVNYCPVDLANAVSFEMSAVCL